MNIICKPRNCGKTYDLIMESARTGHPIVTATSAEARFINEEAKRMRVHIKQAISVREYEIFKNNGSLFNSLSWTGKVLIDNVELVLNDLLGAEVVTATCTPDNMKGENNMNSFEKEYGNIWVTPPSVKVNSCTQVADVNIIVPDKVVEVIFIDGTKEKSVCREPDVFSLEQAIGICISKKVMGGSSAYNNAVKHGIKVYENKIREEQMDEEERERIERKRAKRKAYKERRAVKRAQEEREKQIEIQKEAYVRAMLEVESMKNKGV